MWVAPLLAACVALVIGVVWPPDFGPWFDKLRKSPLEPKRHVFGRVWGVLYTLLGVAGVYIMMDENRRAVLAPLYFLQLQYNFLWTPLFTRARLYGLALLDLVATLVVTLVLIGLCVMMQEWTIALGVFLPYAAWLSFASYLNAYIVLHN